MHIKNPTSFLYSESSETPTMAACDLTIKGMVEGFIF